VAKGKLEKQAGGKPSRPCVGVVGGDLACIRTMVNHWTGKSAIRILRTKRSVIRVCDAARRRDLIILLDYDTRIIPWPGGPLIWLFPERGPSEPELAQMRTALNLHSASTSDLRVLLCLPHDVQPEAALEDLDIISETLRWSVDEDMEVTLEAVWLDGDGSSTMDAWLAALR